MADVKISALPPAPALTSASIFASVEGGVTYKASVTQVAAAFPDASATDRGLVTTGTQTFAGSKTFSSAPTFSSLTAGSVLFAGTGGLVSQDNANFFWDDANNRLGIGTVTPGNRLEIVSTSVDALILSNFYSNNANDAGTLILRHTRGTVASPSTTLSGDRLGTILFGGNDGFTFVNTIAIYGTSSENFGGNNRGTNLSIETTTNGSATRSEKLRLFNNGNLTLQNGGTFTDAGFRLDINGTARVQERLTISDDSTVTTETCAVITTDTVNANLVLAPNGQGALIADIPDGGVTGGNARGNNAVDLQTVRSAATQVASGLNSSITGGQNNAAGGNNASVAGGNGNSAAGNNSNVGGGQENAATANFSSVSGGSLGLAYLFGQTSNASQGFAGTIIGDAQRSQINFRKSITGTSIQELFLNGSTDRAIMALPAGGGTNARAWRAQIDLVAIVATAGGGGLVQDECFMGTYLCAIKRVGANTSLVGAVNTVNEVSDTNMATAVTTITADDTNEALKIEFTPPTTADGTTVIRVVATAYLTEVGR